MVVLLTWVNAPTAWLTLASLIGYAGGVHRFLKRATPQNIVLGGLAGCTLPARLDRHYERSSSHALLAGADYFAHTATFLALPSIEKRKYAKAGIPMLPVTHGDAYTKLHILLHAHVICCIHAFPVYYGHVG